MKFSILIPTYNDENYITKSIKSVIEQIFQDWEMIVINDGSTDGTERVVKSFNDQRIKYLYQDNADQLNALLYGSGMITGDIVMILHSDDMISDKNVLKEMNDFFIKNSETDGLYSDYIKINSESEITGKISTTAYGRDIILKLLLFNRGSNSIGDHFVIRKKIFDECVKPNYLIENTVYYIAFQNFEFVKLKKFRPWYKYRVFEENYDNSEVGQYVIISGRFRTTYKLLEKGFNLYPEIFKYYFIYKIFRKLKLSNFLILKINDKNKWEYIINFYKFWKIEILKAGYSELVVKCINKIIDSAIARKSNNEKKPLYLKYNNEKVYYGKDARSFYKDYNTGSISNFFLSFLNSDYDCIIAEDEKTLDAVNKSLRFYSLYFNVRMKNN